MLKVSIYILILIYLISSYSQNLLQEQQINQKRKEIEQFQQAGLYTIENTKNKNKNSSLVNKHADQKFDTELSHSISNLIIPTLSVQDDIQINQQEGLSYSEYQYEAKEFSFKLNLGDKEMRMMLSTYSNIFIVGSNLCSNCDQQKRQWKIYQCQNLTCSNQVKRASSKYFNNKFMDGYVSNDKLLIGGIIMNSVEFLAIFDNQNIYFLQSLIYLGVIGFGAEKQGSLINQMYQQKLIPRNLFCLQTTHFLGQKPQITFGEFNSLFNEQLVHYFPLIEGSKQWKVKMENVTINNYDLFNDKDLTRNLIIAINVDSILIPSIDFQRLLDILDKHMNLRYEGQNSVRFECSKLDYQQIFPIIEFTLKDENQNLIAYKITPLDYVKNDILQTNNKEFCTMKILPTNDSDWIIGDIFLKHTYSIFNYEKSAIGFIDLRQLRQQTDDDQEGQVTNNNQKPKQLGKILFYFILILCLIAIGVQFYNKKHNIQSQNNEQDNGIEFLPLNNYQQ